MQKTKCIAKYFIIKESLFKNTSKIFGIYTDHIVIKNADNTDRETVLFEDILMIKYNETNSNEFKIAYTFNDNEIHVNYITYQRTNLLNDLLTQIDLNTKINKYPVETYQCFFMLKLSEYFQNFDFDFEEDELNFCKTNLGEKFIFDINLKLYRSNIQWIQVENQKEQITNFAEIEKLYTFNIKSAKAIVFQTYKKFNFVIIPKKQEEYDELIDKLITNSKTVLGYDINVQKVNSYENLTQFFNEANAQKFTDITDKKINSINFTYEQVKRIYPNTQLEIILKKDNMFLYELSKSKEIVSYISLKDVIYIVVYEMTESYFEIILKGNYRLIYETNVKTRSLIIASLIENINALKSDSEYLVLPNKPVFSKIIRGFPNDIPSLEYEIGLLKEIEKTSDLTDYMVQISLNFCFKSGSLKKIESFERKEKINKIFTLILKEMEICLNDCLKEDRTKQKFFNQIQRLNYFISSCKNLGSRIYHHKLKTILISCLEQVKRTTIFYNSILFIKELLIKIEQEEILTPRQNTVTEGQRLTFDIINNLCTTDFFKKYTELSIFHEGEPIRNFEEKTILNIYSILKLQSIIFTTLNKKNTQLTEKFLSSFKKFKSLFLIYKLLRCKSTIIINETLKILLQSFDNYSEEDLYHLKSKILNQTIIYPTVLLIYIRNDKSNKSIALQFLKRMVENYIDCANFLVNIFPSTLFEAIENNSNPTNWQMEQWETFFAMIHKDFSQIKLIWNQKCRNELMENLKTFILNYESYIDNKNLISSFSFDNEENSKTTVDKVKYKNFNLFQLNIKELNFVYPCLKKEVFVWQYYLRMIINEKGTPTLECNVAKPKKFWKKLKMEIFSANEQKMILILKTMNLLYKTYFEVIGEFKDTILFSKLFTQIQSFEIKSLIIQLFITVLKISNKDIREKNIRIIVSEQKMEIFLSFINVLIETKKMKFKNSFDFDKDNFDSNEICNSYIDNKLKNFFENGEDDDIEELSEENFQNYSNYKPIDKKSFEESSKEVKVITLIVGYFKLLLKKNKVLITINPVNNEKDTENKEDNETNTKKKLKICYPLPRIIAFFFEDENYKILLNLLYYNNENLIQEILELFILHFNSPLHYFSSMNKFNTIDVLFILMIKYKSKKLFDLLNLIYKYHSVYFDFEFLNMTNEEKIFYSSYPKANKLFCRYFPIHMVYYTITHSFEEFITLLFTKEVQNEKLIWNRTLFKKLIQSLEQNLYDNRKQNLLLNKSFKRNFYNDTFTKYQSCYVYFLSLIKNVNQFNKEHFNSMAQILIDKVSSPSHMKILKKILKFNSGNFELIKEESYSKIYEVCLKQFEGKIEKKGENETKGKGKEESAVFLYLIKIVVHINNLLYSDNKHRIVILINNFWFGVKYILTEKNEELNLYEKSLIRMLLFIEQNSKVKIMDTEENKEILLTILKKISELVFTNLEPENKKLLYISLKLFLSMTNDGKEKYILDTALPYQFLLICSKYKNISPSNINELHRTNSLIKEPTIYELSFQILKNLSSSNQQFDSYLGILLGNVLKQKFDSSEKTSNKFLIKFTTLKEKPYFIWNEHLMNELTSTLYTIISDIQSDKFSEETIKNFSYKTYDNILNIDGIYISIYNKNNKFIIKEPNNFLQLLINEFNNTSKNYSVEERADIILAIGNCIEFSQGDIKCIIDNENLIDNVNKFAKDNISSNEIIFPCINFYHILASNEKTSDNFLNLNLVFCFIMLIQNDNSSQKNSVDKISSILRELYNRGYNEKINLAIFIFLLKKLTKLNQFNSREQNEEIQKISKNILNSICLYFNDKEVGDNLFSLYEYYLPTKIIDNLFHYKEGENNILSKWLDNDVILPDLIWNAEAWKKSVALLEEDCNMILKDANLLENFPRLFFNKKFSTMNQTVRHFFFEISDEYTIDNIYLRFFNKEPSYNIGINLINFLVDVIDDMSKSLEYYCTFSIYSAGSEVELKYLKNKIIVSLTSVMLMIEQINFNNFNSNLGVSNNEEIKNFISNEELTQNNLIGLLQRTFDFQKLLTENICRKLLNLQNVFFKRSSFFSFDNNIRLVYLEIIYLLCSNKSRINFTCDNINLNIIDYTLTDKINSASDFEIIILCAVMIKLFSKDTSFVNIFSTQYFDSFLNVAEKRKNILQYIEGVFNAAAQNSQYGDGVKFKLREKNVQTISIKKIDKKTLNKLSKIWRKEPNLNENVNEVYKMSEGQNQKYYIDDSYINNNNIDVNNIIDREEYQSESEDNIYKRIYPIIPKSTISYFNFNEVNDEQLEETFKKLISENKNNMNEKSETLNEILGYFDVNIEENVDSEDNDELSNKLNESG